MKELFEQFQFLNGKRGLSIRKHKNNASNISVIVLFVVFLTIFHLLASVCANNVNSDEKEDVKRFLEWCNENGVVMNKIKIENVQIEGVTQRGIIATSDILVLLYSLKNIIHYF